MKFISKSTLNYLTLDSKRQESNFQIINILIPQATHGQPIILGTPHQVKYV
jgi:hypothetical protein